MTFFNILASLGGGGVCAGSYFIILPCLLTPDAFSCQEESLAPQRVKQQM